MHHITGKRVAILATHGFEQSEFEVPRERPKEQGATVHLVSLRVALYEAGRSKTGAGP